MTIRWLQGTNWNLIAGPQFQNSPWLWKSPKSLRCISNEGSFIDKIDRCQDSRVVNPVIIICFEIDCFPFLESFQPTQNSTPSQLAEKRQFLMFNLNLPNAAVNINELSLSINNGNTLEFTEVNSGITRAPVRSEFIPGRKTKSRWTERAKRKEN